MKSCINIFYNLYPQNIYKKNNEFYFFIKDRKFYLKEYTRKEDEIDLLLEISNKLYKKGVNVNTFIMNKDGKVLTEINKKKYVLLKVNSIECENVSVEDILLFSENIKIENNNYELNISEKWKNRIDLLEKQVIEYNKEHQIILKSFNYYVGLAENAISYLEILKDKAVNEKLFLSHSRIDSDITLKDLYNPMLFIFDFKSRDISLYIKNKFFNYENIIDEIEKLINNKKINENECIILVARMLYPDYYFDEIERIISLEERTINIKKIIKRIKDYEKFLEEFLNVLNKYFIIPKIKWIANIK